MAKLPAFEARSCVFLMMIEAQLMRRVEQLARNHRFICNSKRNCENSANILYMCWNSARDRAQSVLLLALLMWPDDTKRKKKVVQKKERIVCVYDSLEVAATIFKKIKNKKNKITK